MSVPKFVICHIRNEEYLLPWWLDHHKNKFDHGIIIDYNSSDRSHDIIKEKTPTWQIIPSRNKNFSALPVDLEVVDFIKNIQNQFPRSWIITLNVTEFLIGDTSKLNYIEARMNCLVESHLMIDSPEDQGKYPDHNIPLIKQRHYGVLGDYKDCRWTPNESLINRAFIAKKMSDPEFNQHGGPWSTNRIMRSLHNYDLDYTKNAGWQSGRHFWGEPVPDFQILWYGYSPYNEYQIKRRLVVQEQIPENERRNIYELDAHKLQVRFDFYQSLAKDIKDFIKPFEPQLWSDQ